MERQHVLTSGSATESSEYWRVPSEGVPRPNGFVGTLGRYADWEGRTLCIEGEEIDFGYYDGPTLKRRYIVNGARIVLPTLKLSLEK